MVLICLCVIVLYSTYMSVLFGLAWWPPTVRVLLSRLYTCVVLCLRSFPIRCFGWGMFFIAEFPALCSFTLLFICYVNQVENKVQHFIEYF